MKRLGRKNYKIRNINSKKTVQKKSSLKVPDLTDRDLKHTTVDYGKKKRVQA